MKEEHNQCPTVVIRIYCCGNITFLFDCTHTTVHRPALLHTTGFCFLLTWVCKWNENAFLLKSSSVSNSVND